MGLGTGSERRCNGACRRVDAGGVGVYTLVVLENGNR